MGVQAAWIWGAPILETEAGVGVWHGWSVLAGQLSGAGLNCYHGKERKDKLYYRNSVQTCKARAAKHGGMWKGISWESFRKSTRK